MSLFARLRAAIGSDWTDYTTHAFVRRLGEGTLPREAFQDYLVQDYLFLVQFARANALAAFKSGTVADITRCAEALTGVLEEMHLHTELAARWGLDAAALEAVPEKMATVAYTRYVLDCGQSGDLLALRVALAPCAIGYAEIGEALAPRLREDPAHPYAEWIAEYAGAPFQESAQQATAHLDELAHSTLAPHRFEELVRVFRTATRLESAFWQQGLDAAGG